MITKFDRKVWRKIAQGLYPEYLLLEIESWIHVCSIEPALFFFLLSCFEWELTFLPRLCYHNTEEEQERLSWIVWLGCILWSVGDRFELLNILLSWQRKILGLEQVSNNHLFSITQLLFSRQFFEYNLIYSLDNPMKNADFLSAVLYVCVDFFL